MTGAAFRNRDKASEVYLGNGARCHTATLGVNHLQLFAVEMGRFWRTFSGRVGPPVVT